jgi:hypothetical protein
MKVVLFLASALCFAAIGSLRADIALTNFAPAYTQNFDTLASSGTSLTVPFGWRFNEVGTSANTLYTASNGVGSGSFTGDTYSFGSTSSSDRAFGELSSGNVVSTIGARFTNAGTNAITAITISYYGEQWRIGNSALDNLAFEVSTNATSLTTGTWTTVSALTFSQIFTSPSNSPLDGNLSANRMLKSANNIALPTAVAPNANFWIRWSGTNATGNDHGLAIDDFSISAVPEPSAVAFAGLSLLGLGMAARRRWRGI